MIKFTDKLTKRILPTRVEHIECVIVHTTGSGSTLDKILAYYQSSDGYQPHYVISTKGELFRTALESKIAYHAGLKAEEIKLYKQGFDEWTKWWFDEKKDKLVMPTIRPEYLDWKSNWFPMQSPLSLVTGEHPNASSIGIELEPPKTPTRDVFFDVQYQALAELIEDICARCAISVSRKRILGHADVNPLRRSTIRGIPWDPGALNWQRLLRMISELPHTLPEVS